MSLGTSRMACSGKKKRKADSEKTRLTVWRHSRTTSVGSYTETAKHQSSQKISISLSAQCIALSKTITLQFSNSSHV